MALRNAIGSCARTQWWCTKSLPHRLLASRSCDGSSTEPCPPCPPQPRPPCRALPTDRVTATRIVCCPPPQGNPPPCAPPCINPPLTCAEAMPKGRRGGRAATCIRKEVCGQQLDRVARRLELTEKYRRESYEKEAAQRKACRDSFPDLEPYSLGAERECCRATDGRDYRVPCEGAAPAPCGPGRAPPPPRCVELVRDTECQVRGPGRVDPCAHKPRTIVQIDRSERQTKCKEQTPDQQRNENATKLCDDRACSAPPPPSRKFTTRLMESLNLSRHSESSECPGKSCPRRSCDSKCTGEGARRAGDSRWCANLKPPPSVPPPCRKPTQAELLKRRPPSRCGPNDPRCYHTAAPLLGKPAEKKGPSTDQIKADTAKLEKTLKERENYNEAGQGRVATEEALASKPNQPNASLDICVPPGAEKLSVRVVIDDGGCRKKPKCKKPPKCPEEDKPKKTDKICSGCACPASAAPPPPAASAARCASVATKLNEKRDSWLSIKSLLANCRKDDYTTSCPTNAPKKPESPCSAPKSAPSCPCKAPCPCKSPANPSPATSPSVPSPCKNVEPGPKKPASSSPPPSPCKTDKPKDPCSNKTKFASDTELQLETFLLKW